VMLAICDQVIFLVSFPPGLSSPATKGNSSTGLFSDFLKVSVAEPPFLVK
jgi:hypothetical protein